jgi:hypothetical protein
VARPALALERPVPVEQLAQVEQVQALQERRARAGRPCKPEGLPTRALILEGRSLLAARARRQTRAPRRDVAARSSANPKAGLHAFHCYSSQASDWCFVDASVDGVRKASNGARRFVLSPAARESNCLREHPAAS